MTEIKGNQEVIENAKRVLEIINHGSELQHCLDVINHGLDGRISNSMCKRDKSAAIAREAIRELTKTKAKAAFKFDRLKTIGALNTVIACLGEPTQDK